ncbi:hypothetical protein R3P38DRAFT_2799172 [Favolaschia claudopus]|uniref:Uncharacterized protein n=1 Tax=Favolaschia claudopus TaxID=2862362 RepID=A0AAW0A1B0_9AGAR
MSCIQSEVPSGVYHSITHNCHKYLYSATRYNTSFSQAQIMQRSQWADTRVSRQSTSWAGARRRRQGMVGEDDIGSDYSVRASVLRERKQKRCGLRGDNLRKKVRRRSCKEREEKEEVGGRTLTYEGREWEAKRMGRGRRVEDFEGGGQRLQTCGADVVYGVEQNQQISRDPTPILRNARQSTRISIAEGSYLPVFEDRGGLPPPSPSVARLRCLRVRPSKSNALYTHSRWGHWHLGEKGEICRTAVAFGEWKEGISIGRSEMIADERRTLMPKSTLGITGGGRERLGSKVAAAELSRSHLDKLTKRRQQNT